MDNETANAWKSAYLDEGLPVRKIAARFGASEWMVATILKEIGVEVKNRRYKDKTLRVEAARLYVEERKTTYEIAALLKASPATILRWLHDLSVPIRSPSEVAILRSENPKKNGYLRSLRAAYQSSKMGCWFIAHSRYEVARMMQLDGDDDVASWKRCDQWVSLPGGKRYMPDFDVTYRTGRRVIEEVKPSHLLTNELVLLKAQCAKEFFSKEGAEYVFVTEHEIGKERIKNVDTDLISFDIKRAAKPKKDNSAYHRAYYHNVIKKNPEKMARLAEIALASYHRRKLSKEDGRAD